MRNRKLPLVLYKKPDISHRNGNSIITFEYFNVKKYRYEVFEIDHTFSSGDITNIEKQCKKVHKALKRGYGPDIDLIEGEFIDHTVSMVDIDIVTHLSWLDLIICEIYGWWGNGPKNLAGGVIGLVIGCNVFQFASIITLITKKAEFADVGFLLGIGIYISIAILFDLFLESRVKEHYYFYYLKLPSEFRDYIARIIIPVSIQALIGAVYFFIKIGKEYLL